MTAIIFVTHPNPVKVSLAFLAGVTAAMVLGTTIYYLLAGTVDLGDPSSTGSSGTIIQLVLAGLLALLALRTYRHRATIEPPKWLGGVMEASPTKALLMGFLLIFVMPTDIASMATVGANLQQNDKSLINALPFWGLTLLIAALPILSYLLFRNRGEDGDAEGARLDVCEQLAGEHQRHLYLHRPHPRMRSAGVGPVRGPARHF